jgi:hypothetical protein
MSAVNSTIAHRVLPLLIAALLATGCSDSTGPVSEEPGDATSESPVADSAPARSQAASVSMAATSPGSTPTAALALATAYSKGFYCIPAGRAVVQNMPNITSISGRIESTYFRAELYRWNPQLRYGHGDWQLVKDTGWYAGASDGSGNRPIAPYLTYSSAMWMQSGRYVGNSVTWSSLPSGYYATKEYYRWQNGWTASRWNGASTYCAI